MDKEYIMSCSYNDLKKIAVEHNIFKSIKSKKKNALLEKILNHFSEDGKESSEVVIEKGAIIDEEVPELPKKLNKSRRGKRTKSKEVLVNEDEMCEETNKENQQSQEVADRRGTFVVASKKDLMADVKKPALKNSDRGRRGKKNKSKEILISEDELDNEKNNKTPDLDNDDRRQTFIVSKLGKDSPEEKLVSPKKSARSGKQRKARSKENLLSTDEDVINEDKPDGKIKLPEVANKSSRFSIGSKKVASPNEEIPELPKKSNKGRRGRKRVKSNDIQANEVIADVDISVVKDEDVMKEASDLRQKSNRGAKGRNKKLNVDKIDNNPDDVVLDLDNDDKRQTFLVSKLSKDSPEEILVSPKKSTRSGKQRKARSKENLLTTDEDVINEDKPDEEIKLPEGPVPIINRRGTFTVTVSKPLEETTNEMELSSPRLRGSQEKKRKKSEVEESPQENIDIKENIDKKGKIPTKIKKVGIVAPSASRFINKTVNFLTPENSRKRTPKKSNVSLTPHPIKKTLSTPLSKRSISSPLSVKKTPGLFSAKKMPNFSKIHKKNFQKMESLVAYSERKTARKDLLSPLNKTFTGLSDQERITKKARDSTGRKPAKSLIPVRSGIIRLENKEKIKSFATKTHVTNIEAMREKERDLIKGVRANKRFMLQMKMRKIDM